MMRKPEVEREIKVLDIDVPDLLSKLQSLRAIKRYDTTMRIISYDLSREDLLKESIDSDAKEVLIAAVAYYKLHGSLRSSNAHLRLRYRDDSDEAELCFKRNTDEQSSQKVALEYNATLPFKSARAFESAAMKIGLEQIAVHEKKRVSYQLSDNDCVCDIDTYPKVPTYVELEHPDESVINTTVQLLGLKDCRQSDLSGEDFFALYGVDYYSTLVFKG
jgi:adenylate cyclase class IV